MSLRQTRSNTFVLLNAALVIAACCAFSPAQFVGDVRIRDERMVPPGRPVPPRVVAPSVEKHMVRVVFAEGVATTTVRQVFRNTNGWQLEGTYFFPLPDAAALSGFSMLMGGKMVAGEVLEKEKAAKIYRDIVSRAQDPALLEYVGRRLFQAKVFPIPALGTAEIELTYSETLLRNGATVEYRYPLRTHGASPAPVPDLSISVEAQSKTPMRVVYSPSHAVDVVKKGDFAFKASFEQKGAVADRDFSLVVGLGADAVGATLLTHAEAKDDGAFVLLFSPSDDAATAESLPKDVVFVADTSGSMAGDKMEQLKRALSFCVKSLDPRDRFNLVTFSTESRTWKDALSPADTAAKDAALQFISERQALGGTNIADALSVALSTKKDPSRPFLVIFLTDGLPTVGLTDVETILKDAKGRSENARVFVFGIGKDVNTVLLDRLAEENRGARDYVGEREDLEVKLSSFFQKVASPVLTDLKLIVEGVKALDLYPRVLPDLFRGSQAMIAGRYLGAGDAKVRLEGRMNGRSVGYDFALRFGDSGKEPAVPRLWAVRKVGFLMDQIRLNGAAKELTDEIVRLGVKYGIVTPYTSYLVVEDIPTGASPRPGTVRGLDSGSGREGGRWTRGVPEGEVAKGGGGARPAGGGLPPRSDPNSPPNSRGAAPGNPAPGTKLREPGDLSLEEVADAARDGKAGEDKFGERDRLVDAEREKAVQEVRKSLEKDPVALSLRILRLRDAQGDDGLPAGALVKRVGDRTFYYREGLYVEAAALQLSAETLKTGVLRIKAFSDAYFDLLTQNPGLAGVLALGDVLFVLDGKPYLVVAGDEPESRPAESRPIK